MFWFPIILDNYPLGIFSAKRYMRIMLDITSLQQIFYFVEYLSPTNSNYLNKSNKLNYLDNPDYLDNSNKFQLSQQAQLSQQPQLNNLDHLDDLRISPRPAAIAITEELSSPALGGTASK
jgi:hypothetical protein